MIRANDLFVGQVQSEFEFDKINFPNITRYNKLENYKDKALLQQFTRLLTEHSFFTMYCFKDAKCIALIFLTDS